MVGFFASLVRFVFLRFGLVRLVYFGLALCVAVLLLYVSLLASLFTTMHLFVLCLGVLFLCVLHQISVYLPPSSSGIAITWKPKKEDDSSMCFTLYYVAVPLVSFCRPVLQDSKEMPKIKDQGKISGRKSLLKVDPEAEVMAQASAMTEAKDGISLAMKDILYTEPKPIRPTEPKPIRPTTSGGVHGGRRVVSRCGGGVGGYSRVTTNVRVGTGRSCKEESRVSGSGVGATSQVIFCMFTLLFCVLIYVRLSRPRGRLFCVNILRRPQGKLFLASLLFLLLVATLCMIAQLYLDVGGLFAVMAYLHIFAFVVAIFYWLFH